MGSSDGFCPSVWGKVELSLGLHPALIPAARSCVIREDRLNSAWPKESGKWEFREIPLPLL